MLVLLKMPAEAIYSLTEHCHLHLGRTGIGSVGLVGVDQLLLFGGVERHARGAGPYGSKKKFYSSMCPVCSTGLFAEPLQAEFQPRINIVV